MSEVINELSGCLALVRPVGMNEDMASEWLTIAANEIHGYPRWLVKSALAAARRECDHYGKIVAFAIKHMEKNFPHYNPQQVHRDRQMVLDRQRAPQLEQSPAMKALIDATTANLRA